MGFKIKKLGSTLRSVADDFGRSVVSSAKMDYGDVHKRSEHAFGSLSEQFGFGIQKKPPTQPGAMPAMPDAGQANLFSLDDQRSRLIRNQMNQTNPTGASGLLSSPMTASRILLGM